MRGRESGISGLFSPHLSAWSLLSSWCWSQESAFLLTTFWILLCLRIFE